MSTAIAETKTEARKPRFTKRDRMRRDAMWKCQEMEDLVRLIDSRMEVSGGHTEPSCHIYWDIHVDPDGGDYSEQIATSLEELARKAIILSALVTRGFTF